MFTFIKHFLISDIKCFMEEELQGLDHTSTSITHQLITGYYRWRIFDLLSLCTEEIHLNVCKLYIILYINECLSVWSISREHSFHKGNFFSSKRHTFLFTPTRQFKLVCFLMQEICIAIQPKGVKSQFLLTFCRVEQSEFMEFSEVSLSFCAWCQWKNKLWPWLLHTPLHKLRCNCEIIAYLKE